ncbi:SET and MYND domain-containing protein 4 [Heteronotia binoei]|uniref:SET and MYND domain-containing protein 4 n=1 Tax=Heteronotia binoei TaxID=13085 RepID=UPI0029314F83|nr:SET and MYND domain-containing protein 4 [Heteronotia binoei]
MDLPMEKWQSYVKQKWTLLGPTMKEKLCSALTLQDRFLLVSSLFQPEDEEYLHHLARNYCVKKDPRMALLYKAEGNERFQKKQYQMAGMLYSKALSHTEVSTPERAVCYANRSAALFHLDEFEVCLEDIGRALAEGYPQRLHPKILLRKVECLLCLGRSQEGAEVLSGLESEMSEDQSPAPDSHQGLLSKLRQLKAKACKDNSAFVRQPTMPSSAQEVLEPWEENSRISCASAAVCLRVSPGKGRHLVAARDILPGEVLVREEAFVSVLLPGESLLLQGSAEAAMDEPLDNEDLHCHHCLRQLLTSIPCQGCSYAKYCSQMCAQLAWENYHQRECSLGGLLLTLGVFCHVAFRAILVAGFAEICTLAGQSHGENSGEANAAKASTSKEQDSASSVSGCDAEGQYRSSYRAIFSLLSHAKKHSPEFLFLCSLSVAALCKRLGESSLAALVWEKSPPESQEGATPAEASPELEILGEAMLKHVLQLRCNAQAITTVRKSGSGDKLVTSKKQVRLAVALFPVVSLLNHSCDPNITVTFSSSTAEIRALQPVAKGQEILHCYGPHKSRMGAAERRRKLLAQYFFDCQCQACLSELESSSGRGVLKYSIFRCPTCQAPLQEENRLLCCEACKALIYEDDLQHQLWELRQMTKTAQDMLEMGQPDQSLKLLLRCRSEAQRFLCPEHLMVGEIEDHLAKAYAALGKWQTAAGHLRSSIQAVEARYGPSSVEVGQELFKLAQVLFNGRAVPEALTVVEKAERILSVHLGLQNSQVQELHMMKAFLEEALYAFVASGRSWSSPGNLHTMH